MVKKLLIVGGVVLIAVLVTGLFVTFDSPGFGRAVLAKASQSTGIALEASQFRLNLLRGLELQDVEASSSFPGGRYRLELDGLIFEHRLLPLLTGQLSVDRIVVDRPRVEVLRGVSEASERAPRPSPEGGRESDDPLGEAAEQPSAGGLELEVSEIELRDGAVVMRDQTSEGNQFSLEGLQLSLRDLSYDGRALTPVHALSASGDVAMDALHLDATTIANAEGRIQMNGGRFELAEITFATEEGSFGGNLELDFNVIPFRYRMSLAGDPLNVNAIVGAEDGGFGPGAMTFEAEGFGTESEDLEGQGRLSLQAGKLPATPALERIEALLGRTQIVGSPYEATETPFSIRDNHLRLESFSLSAPQVGLDLHGSASLDGPMDFELTLRTPRERLVIKEVPNEALDALTNEEGWVSLPFRITGTREEPSVRLDGEALAAQLGRGSLEVLKEEVLERLKSLFGKEKNP